MKKQLITLTTGFLISCLFTATALAETTTQSHLEQVDNTAYTQICLASLVSKRALREKARELGIGKNERTRIVCNELTLHKFAQVYANKIDVSTIATVE